jgi:hypothetical protein
MTFLFSSWRWILPDFHDSMQLLLTPPLVVWNRLPTASSTVRAASGPKSKSDGWWESTGAEPSHWLSTA